MKGDRVAGNHRVEPRDRYPRDLGKEFPDVDEESPTRHPLEGTNHESRTWSSVCGYISIILPTIIHLARVDVTIHCSQPGS
jgi:hypothetical protein